MAESKVDLSPENAKICAAKIRALDTFMADNSSSFFSGDYDFIASMKDWVDKYHRTITKRQDWRVNQIWNHITDTTELSYEDRMEG